MDAAAGVLYELYSGPACVRRLVCGDTGVGEPACVVDAPAV